MSERLRLHSAQCTVLCGVLPLSTIWVKLSATVERSEEADLPLTGPLITYPLGLTPEASHLDNCERVEDFASRPLIGIPIERTCSN